MNDPYEKTNTTGLCPKDSPTMTKTQLIQQCGWLIQKLSLGDWTSLANLSTWQALLVHLYFSPLKSTSQVHRRGARPRSRRHHHYHPCAGTAFSLFEHSSLSLAKLALMEAWNLPHNALASFRSGCSTNFCKTKNHLWIRNRAWEVNAFPLHCAPMDCKILCFQGVCASLWFQGLTIFDELPLLGLQLEIHDVNSIDQRLDPTSGKSSQPRYQHMQTTHTLMPREQREPTGMTDVAPWNSPPICAHPSDTRCEGHKNHCIGKGRNVLI